MSINKPLAKMVPFLLLIFVFAILSMIAHEYFHFHTARLEHIKVHVLFNSDWLGGRTVFEESVTHWQEFWIWLMGGIGTAALFGVLWALSAWQGHWTKWNMDDSMVYGIIVFVNLFYGIAEGLFVWTGDPWWGELTGVIVGASVIGRLYWIPFMRWVREEE